MDESQLSNIAFSDIFTNIRSVLSVLKDTKELIGDTGKEKAVDHSILQAEKAIGIAEAQIAQALNYQLCQCTFPPQIMLSSGRHQEFGDEVFICPHCEKQEPSEQTFNHRSRSNRMIEQHNAGNGKSWMGS